MNTELIISMGLVGVMLSMLFMGLLIAYYGSSKTRNVGLIFLTLYSSSHTHDSFNSSSYDLTSSLEIFLNISSAAIIADFIAV